jgi:NTP pyrophosphatase (non-canonical NTP hydrolase)
MKKIVDYTTPVAAAAPVDITPEGFKESVERTWNRGLSERDQLGNAGMGLAGEAGEVCDLLKKHLYHGKALDRAELVKELGDVLFYFTALLSTVGLTYSEVALVNKKKLELRFPEGFSAKDANEKKDEKQ